jgi:hypothetical protein
MRQEQADSWRDQEARLQLVARGNKKAFFEGITPLLGRLKPHVKRLLRAASNSAEPIADPSHQKSILNLIRERAHLIA